MLSGYGGLCATYHDSVVPSKNGKLVESSYQIPPRSDVAGYEDRKGEDGEWVHESPTTAGASPCYVQGLVMGGWEERGV